MSSKLRKLKQQAYEAGRKRDWSGAAEIYANILEMDKSNPSLLNEYGDVCLKAGETGKAMRQFLAAAAKYKQNGLLNNAQAVYKKVLRHDAKNLNANWFLAEIRSSQGLLGDGVSHALTFLAAAEGVSGEIKEIFLKRCLELFDLYPGSDEVLERVEGIFRIWDMPLEMARAGCLRACVSFRAGEKDAAQTAVDQYVQQVPELVNYAEYTKWLQASGQADAPAGFSDVNAIALDGDGDGAAPPAGGSSDLASQFTDADIDETQEPDRAPATDAAPAEQPEQPEAETSAEPLPEGPESGFDDILGTDGEPAAAADGTTGQAPDPGPAEVSVDAELDVEKDDDGCISIDLDGGETSFADLIDEAATVLENAGVEIDENETENETAAEVDVEAPVPAATVASVNLLDEILAEEGDDLLRSSDTEQVSTIASEIGRNLGDQMDMDPESQYQQGLVYLEMGLYDQAGLAFSAAAADPAHTLQAREMWGIALQREGRLDDALTVLEAGLAGDEDGGRSVLGLHYQAGRILEEMERGDEAQEHYRQVHSVDAGFADVAERLRTTVA